MRQRKRPQADIEIRKNLGFDVDVMDAKVPRTRTLLDSLKYGSWSDRGYFMVKGIGTILKTSYFNKGLLKSIIT